jgi:hypothetical protein
MIVLTIKPAIGRKGQYGTKRLKMKFNACLFHDGVGSVTRFNFGIDGKIDVRFRAVPNVMVALAMPDKSTLVVL